MDEFDRALSPLAREFQIQQPAVCTNLLYLDISEKKAQYLRVTVAKEKEKIESELQEVSPSDPITARQASLAQLHSELLFRYSIILEMRQV